MRTTSRALQIRFGVLAACSLPTTLFVACALDDRLLLPKHQTTYTGGGADTDGPSTSAGAGQSGEASSVAGAGGDPSSAGAPSAGAGGAPDLNQGGAAGTGDVLVGTCPDRNQNQVADCEETLVQNPNYDLDVAAWLGEPNVEIEWAPQDGAGVAESGSALITNSNFVDADGVGMSGSRQCISTTGGQMVDVYADVLVKGGQVAGSGGVNVWFLEAADCSGVPIGVYTAPVAAVPGGWTTVHGSREVPAGTSSMLVRLVVSKPFRVPDYQVLFDNVLVEVK